MKSINFTLLEDKILEGSKTQTIRCLYIPTFEEDEVIFLKFKKREIMQVKITEIYPKKIKDLTLEEAIRDGFDNLETLQSKLLEINGLNSMNRFCFVIRWVKMKTLEDFL